MEDPLYRRIQSSLKFQSETDTKNTMKEQQQNSTKTHDFHTKIEPISADFHKKRTEIHQNHLIQAPIPEIHQSKATPQIE